jgi:hypothetical protein
VERRGGREREAVLVGVVGGCCVRGFCGRACALRWAVGSSGRVGSAPRSCAAVSFEKKSCFFLRVGVAGWPRARRRTGWCAVVSSLLPPAPTP